MKKYVLFFFVIFCIAVLRAQEGLEYFLPTEFSYDPKIPTPEAFFGHLPGEWHLTHAQVLDYMREISSISERGKLEEYARSYENKSLVQLIFTSHKNQEKLEALRKLHLQFLEPGSTASSEGVPLVVRLGYGVHGNESSATNSSVISAYYLAAAQGEQIDRLLDSTFILLDPCLNPDGYTRHSTWTNSFQGAVANGDANSWQFREQWPRGRTNHYWFDLNRDYLPLVNPESRGRVEAFHKWLPNIVTDHHESSANFTFFFQPGIPSRNHPLIPEDNYRLTSAIAAYHAAYLDRVGAAYFSEESFDDYYFGKGSTYPDIHGSIGILFEQSSLRGRIRETSNGTKTLAFSMRNQFTATLSTLQAALDMRKELLAYQKAFFQEAWEEAGKSAIKAYLFSSGKDRVKTREFVDFLNRHQVRVYGLKQELKRDNQVFSPSSSYIVPLQQKQYRLIRTIFEEVHSFRDTSFYDVSTWTMPHAFDVPVLALSSLKGIPISDHPLPGQKIKGSLIGGKAKTGYLFRWNEYATPEVLYALQNAGLLTKVATEEFSIRREGKMEDFGYGSILIPVNHQPMNPEDIHELIAGLAEKSGVDFYALSTGWTPRGIDMGSSSLASLEKPRVLMFISGSTSAALAGEIWHLLDQRYRIPLTLSGTERLSSIDLGAYTTVILPGGSYREWGEEEVEELRRWTEKGGILLACGTATGWASGQKLGKSAFKDPVPLDSTRYLAYAERRKESTLQGIGGAILKAELDLSHPLCYGYTRADLAIFKRGTRVALPLGEKYLEPVKFAPDPYLSGWISTENLERIKEAPVLSVQHLGAGKLISFHESMNFRGFWMGSNKLFMNAIFFGRVIR